MQFEFSAEDWRDSPFDGSDTTITLSIEPPRPCRVLLVDDDQVVVYRLTSLLRPAGYEVHSASSGKEALRFLESTFCQVVLTGWHMPDMDGLELCRRLRCLRSNGYIYLLMLTGRSGSADVVTGLTAGADDYVVKGAAPEEILARVEVGRRITHLESSLRASNRESRRMSVTDPLTGAKNRRYLMKYLPRVIEHAVRDGSPIAVVSFDVDHFKRINDDFGHDTGDQVLQQLVSRSSSVVRRGIDWISRAGGEEFVMVLPRTDMNGANIVASRLRSAIVGEPIYTSTGRLDVTVSVGVSALDGAPELGATSADELLRAADDSVYASKALGRDRITAASPAQSRAVLTEARTSASRGTLSAVELTPVLSEEITHAQSPNPTALQLEDDWYKDIQQILDDPGIGRSGVG
jgi:two-component system, cell cycle response regulator